MRGVVMLCGFLMVPRAADAGGGCTITMIVHTDLGGNLPAKILNFLSTSSPWRLVQRLRGNLNKPGAANAATTNGGGDGDGGGGAAMAMAATATTTATAAVAVNGDGGR